MATLLYQRDITLQFSDLDRRVPLERPTVPRSRYPGLHVSGVLGAIAERVGWLKTEAQEEGISSGGSDRGSRAFSWIMAQGIMFEEFYFSLPWVRDEGTVWQPGEVVKDGIAANPDGVTPWVEEAEDAVLEETKFTSLKARDWAQLRIDKRVWDHQVRCYCYMSGLTHSRQTIGYYRGDYRGSGPIYRQYLVRWAEDELRQSWEMVQANREYAKAEG